MKVSTEYLTEVKLVVHATYDPGRPAWGGARGEPPINPPEEASFDDIEVVDIQILAGDWVSVSPKVKDDVLFLYSKIAELLEEDLRTHLFEELPE